MTKQFIPLAILVIFLLAGCRHVVGPEDEIPDWLAKVIQQLEAEPFGSSPGYIARYEYYDKIVYYQPQRCCDIPSTLWNEQGDFLCSPDGGYFGRGDGRCPDFFQKRKNERIIWQDRRRHP